MIPAVLVAGSLMVCAFGIVTPSEYSSKWMFGIIAAGPGVSGSV